MADGPPTYRLFLDETVVKTNGEQERTWFALVGCVLALGHHGRHLHTGFENLKGQFFKHHSTWAPVVFHRIDMCCASPRGAFSVLRDEAKRNDFYDGLLELIKGCDFKVFSAIEPIGGYREKQRTDWRTLGYTRCLGQLLTSYCEYLSNLNVRGDVMASHLGMKEHTFIRVEYWKTLRDGGHGKLPSFFRRRLTKTLKIERKEKNVAGLQLADLIAAPVIRKQLAARSGNGDNVERFAREVAEIAAKKRP